MDAAAVRVYITGFDLFLQSLFLASLIAHYTVWDKCYVNTSGTQKCIFLCVISVT